MLDNLEAAIYAKFAATSALTTAFPSRTDGGTTIPVAFYWDLAYEGAPTPFVVATNVSATNELKYGGIAHGDADIQFAVYATGGRSAARALMATVTGVFDELILTVSGSKQVNTVRLGEPLCHLDSRDAQGNEVFQVIVTYRFTMTP